MCAGYESFGRDRFWRQAGGAPRLSERKKPRCEDCGCQAGAAYVKWLPRNHGPTWESRSEDARGHYVSPLSMPAALREVHLYHCPEPKAPRPARIQSSLQDESPRKSALMSAPDQENFTGITGAPVKVGGALPTSDAAYIAPIDVFDRYRKCDGRGDSGCVRVWRQ